MQYANFKLASHNKLSYTFFVLYISMFFVFIPYFKNGTIKFYSPFILVSLIAIISIGYITSLIKLTITNKEITFSVGVLSKLGWTLPWSEVDEALLIYAPMGSHRILLKSHSKNRQIILSMWQFQEGTIPLIEDKKNLLKSRFNKTPEDFSVYQAALHFHKNIREASSREATEVIQRQLDLGTRAGYASGAAVVFMLIAIGARFLDKSTPLDSGYVTYTAATVSVIVGVITLYYLRRGPNISANIFIGLLCTGLSYWALYSLNMTSTYLFGNEVKFTYTLQSQNDSYQEWKNNETEVLVLRIYAKSDNLKLTSIGATKEVLLVKGFFNNYSIKHAVSHEFLIDPNRRR